MDQLTEIIDQLLSLAKSHAWLPFAAALLALLVRLCRDDKFASWFPVTIPAKYRAWAALGGGVIIGVLDALIAGAPLVTALVNGLIAALIAIGGHETIVEGVRGGREFGVKKGSIDDPTVDRAATTMRIGAKLPKP